VNKKLSELNYEIVDRNSKNQVMHINHMKKACKDSQWETNTKEKVGKKRCGKRTKLINDDEQELLLVYPLLKCPETVTARSKPRTQQSEAPEGSSPDFSPNDDRMDPTFQPGDTPRTRHEIQPSREEPPLT
jgi:hypothetical protein